MREPVSTKQNIWFNGQSVDNTDLNTEQNYNNLVQTSLIANHFGTGVVPEFLGQKVLFDSDLATGLLDGKATDVQKQPTDNNFGHQLEVELVDSKVAGKRTVKLLIIGLDFEGNLKYDRIAFHKNEKQYTRRHYTKILKILFNDFKGTTDKSLNLGGRFIIRESKALALSRHCIMVAQDSQPDIFFRDFFVATGTTLSKVLTDALPSYNIDTLKITSGYKQLRNLEVNDVSSQIGQKFQATTNNIQKITLLMAVSNAINPADLQWTGDLIVSIFQLQSAIDCPLDIAPGTAIDFDPSNIPLAQLSFNYDTLLARGIQLNETPQPVDFIFSNTPVADGSILKKGSYYVVTVKRAGSANKCIIQFATGADLTKNSRITFFNGSIWVDVTDEDLWFQIWTDAAKVADGQAYDAGHGIIIPKIQVNSSTNAIEDYSLEGIQFVRNDVYYGITEAVTKKSDPVQDQRTGELVLSKRQFIPQVVLINSADLTTREVAADPLIIGTISDKNSKTFNAGAATVTSKFHQFGMVGNQCVLKVIDDPSDGYRYDLTVLSLITELTGSGGISNINGLINGKLIPNSANANSFYRIADTEIFSMFYGDLNGDGVVDNKDLLEAQALVDTDLNTIPTRENYITLTTFFKTATNVTWQLIDTNLTVLDSGSDGYLTVDPVDGTKAVFSSISVNFNSFTPITNKKIVISGDPNNDGNKGTFKITRLVNSTIVDIQKTYYTSDTILKILRADINGDMKVDATDISLITNYINKVAPFPATTSPGNKVAAEFTAIRFTLEKYIDREDDYTASSNRSSAIHTLPDVLLDGYAAGSSMFGRDLKNNAITFTVTKQLEWKEQLVNSTSNPKMVPVSFNYQEGYVLNECTLKGIINERYPLPPVFDRGRNDLLLPNNLILDYGGEVIRPDGYYYKVDFEVATIVLEVPAVSFATEKTINVFNDFVANFSGDGHTRLGYESQRFADCSFVAMDALTKNQVRFTVSLKSFSPEVNGEDSGGTTGIIVDGRIGVSLNAESGILSLNFANLYEDATLQTRKTRIQITVFLKRAGFNNNDLTINSTQVKNLLGL